MPLCHQNLKRRQVNKKKTIRTQELVVHIMPTNSQNIELWLILSFLGHFVILKNGRNNKGRGKNWQFFLKQDDHLSLQTSNRQIDEYILQWWARRQRIKLYIVFSYESSYLLSYRCFSSCKLWFLTQKTTKKNHFFGISQAASKIKE